MAFSVANDLWNMNELNIFVKSEKKNPVYTQTHIHGKMVAFVGICDSLSFSLSSRRIFSFEKCSCIAAEFEQRSNYDVKMSLEPRAAHPFSGLCVQTNTSASSPNQTKCQIKMRNRGELINRIHSV